MLTIAKRGKRDNVFDFLRLFAATSVVVHHGVNLLGGSFLWHGTEDGLWFGDGVAMFFVMSGMFVYISGERTYAATGRWYEYFRNRFLRVAPAIYVYTAVVLLALPLIGVIGWSEVFTPGVAIWVGASALLAPGYDPQAFETFGTGIINGALWTIPAEVTFYVAVPIMFVVAVKIGFSRMLLVATPIAIGSPIFTHLVGGSIENILHHTFFEYFACFLVGVFWSKYWDRAPKHWSLFVLAIALYIAAITLPPADVSEYLNPLLFVIPLSYATVWFGYQGPLILQSLTKRIGDISFGTYIWHWPLINLFIWANWDFGALTIPALVLFSWAMGASSWWLVERPALKIKKVSARQMIDADGRLSRRARRSGQV